MERLQGELVVCSGRLCDLVRMRLGQKLCLLRRDGGRLCSQDFGGCAEVSRFFGCRHAGYKSTEPGHGHEE